MRLTQEDTAIIDNLTFGSFALSEMGEIHNGDERDWRIVFNRAMVRGPLRAMRQPSQKPVIYWCGEFLPSTHLCG